MIVELNCRPWNIGWPLAFWPMLAGKLSYRLSVLVWVPSSNVYVVHLLSTGFLFLPFQFPLEALSWWIKYSTACVAATVSLQVILLYVCIDLIILDGILWGSQIIAFYTWLIQYRSYTCTEVALYKLWMSSPTYRNSNFTSPKIKFVLFSIICENLI